MKYIFALLFVLVTVKAQQNEEEIIIESQPAQFMPMGMNRMNPMMYSRNQFPVDYSQGCSGSCGCVQRCQMIWWMPCNCWCPPPCATTEPPPELTNPPTTTSTITTTSTTVTTTTQAPTTTAPSCCCSGCSCTPCTIWWMCPPRCPGNCCSNSCRPCPPPTPPPCCSCTPCLPWAPCSPCNCNNPCATTTAPLIKEEEKEPEYEDPRFPNLRDRLRNGLDIILSPRQPEPEPLPENKPWRMW